MYRYITSIFILLFFISCSTDDSDSEQVDIDSLPVVTPQQLLSVDQAGEYFFNHLAYSTVALENGDIVIMDRGSKFILKIDPDGKLVEKITGEGRGPGEIQDGMSLSSDPGGSIATYDQYSHKVVQFPPDGSDPVEFMLRHLSEGERIRNVYLLDKNNRYLLFAWHMAAMMDENADHYMRVSVYDRESEEVLSDRIYPSREYAISFIDGRPAGASLIPYAPELLYTFAPDNSTFFLNWNESTEIAELNQQLDTLRTITLPIKGEQITNAVRDSIEESYESRNPAMWRAVEPLLPEQKVPFDKLVVDHNNRFWLKLTRSSEMQEWLVTDPDGTPELLVHLPKEGMLTHVSEHHLGFRADDHIFSLFEPVE